MEMLNWIFDGQQYSLETVYGRAVIVELPGKAKAKVIGAADRMEYLAYLELKDDIGSSASPHRFDNFETAEAFLLWHELASLDSNEELSQTLQYCVDLLTRANVNSTHLLRLQIVAGTLKLPELRFKESINKERVIESNEWLEVGNGYYRETHHGTAVIIEKRGRKLRNYGGSSGYRPTMKHSTGAKLHGPNFYTFEAAEEWILSSLEQLDNPTGGRIDIECIGFTFDICINLLPDDADPIHFVRLKTMMTRYSGIVL